ncbi:hypothetical protein [Serinicoccus marinus]|uniref:hypothetical protein n=1 Tax=Serinicoccus marinus TaxID=247333 RepID=UPI0003B75B7E|nr:hypothetical protein [Serinicoccus marinus]
MTTTDKSTATRRTAGAKKSAPAPKSTAPKPEVDLTRKTPHGTKYRVARTGTAEVKSDSPWVAVCLDHGKHAGAKSLKEACLLGTKGRTAEWCPACKRLVTKAEKPTETSKSSGRPTTRANRSEAAEED